MSCFFTEQVLTQLDLLMCWKETAACETHVYLLPKQFHESGYIAPSCTRCGCVCRSNGLSNEPKSQNSPLPQQLARGTPQRLSLRVETERSIFKNMEKQRPDGMR